MVALLDTAGRVDLELEGFEAIPAGDRFLLLRIGGRWSLAAGVPAPVPRLVLQHGARRERFEILPGSTAEWGEDWWAGFAVPAARADGNVRYWLEAGEDARYPLPAPIARELVEGERPQIVVRGGRPYLLVAAGLMAAAVIPLSTPNRARADDVVAPTADPSGAAPPTTAPSEVPPTDPAAAPPVVTTPPPVATTPPPVVTTPPPVPAPPAPAPAPAPVTAAPAPKPERVPKHAPAKQAPPHPKARPHTAPRHEPKAAPAKQAPPLPKPRVAAPPRQDINVAPAKQVTPTVKPAVDAAPSITPSPSPLVQRFAIPPFLLPIYQAAAVQYDVPWQVLAAINAVETDYGRNLSISSAGAEGWMQFMPATWSQFGVDANLDGRRDAANPADAVFAAARYLSDAGAAHDVRGAIFAYNHASWYVDDVMAKARALGRLPDGAVAAMAGLADGRFPVPGSHVRYTRAASGWVTPSAASDGGSATMITGPVGRDVVAAVGGRVIYQGHSRNGAWIVLEDAYGNRFTYGHLAHAARHYPRLRSHTPSAAEVARELHLDTGAPHATFASYRPSPTLARQTWPSSKERLFAHPTRPDAATHGGLAQVDAAPPGVVAAAARRLGVRRAEVVMAQLRVGAWVPAGSVLGRLGGARTRHGLGELVLRVRPAGKHSRTIDAAPLLEAWRLGARGALGPTTSRTKPGTSLGLGRSLLLSDRQLGRLVLRDPRIHLTSWARDEIRAALVDRRVLVALETLADAGERPSVGSLISGPDHPSRARAAGRAADIVALNGRPVAEDPAAARRAQRILAKLPAALRPARTNVSVGSGITAQAASLSSATATGRLTVGYRVASESSAAVSRAVDAALGGGPLTAGPQSGGAPDLHGAPAAVKAMADAADAISGLPYVWGGGHGAWEADGYDCSGTVSYVLHAAGLLDRPLVSGDLASWGAAGEGQWVTIYANATHVIMKIGGQFYGTSGFGHADTGGGPGWFSLTPSPEYLAGFSVRHPQGL